MATESAELIYYAHTLDPEFDGIDIVPISDAHYGNELFHQARFLRTLGFLSCPNAYGILNGDLAESSIRSSVGDIFRQVGSPEDQRDQLIEWLYPYRAKLLGAVDGNHENRIWKEAGIHLVRDIARALEIPYRPEGLLHKISFGNQRTQSSHRPFVFWIYHTHGYGGARTKAAKAVKVERASTWIHAQAYFMSHDHVVNVAPDVYLLPDPRTREEEGTGFRVGRVRAHRKMLVKTNAYLKWGGYSEFLGFPPTDMATPLVKLLSPKAGFWADVPDKPGQAIKVVI